MKMTTREFKKMTKGAERMKRTAKKKDVIVSDVYLHVCNGGFSVRVLDTEFGPCLEVEGLSFGHTFGKSRIYTTEKGLEEVGRSVMESISKHRFNKKYCCAAEYNDYKEKETEEWEDMEKG